MWTEWPHSAPMSYSLFWCHSHPSASFNCTYVVYVKPSTLTLCIQSASLLYCKYCHGNRQSFSFADIFCWLSIRGQNIFRFLHCISWIKTKPYLCNLGLQIEMRCRLMIDPGFIFENWFHYFEHVSRESLKSIRSIGELSFSWFQLLLVLFNIYCHSCPRLPWFQVHMGEAGNYRLSKYLKM